jgi:hypothetical protein
MVDVYYDQRWKIALINDTYVHQMFILKMS